LSRNFKLAKVNRNSSTHSAGWRRSFTR